MNISKTLSRNILLLYRTPKNFLYSFTLSEKEKVVIRPYNPKAAKIARLIMDKIKNVLSNQIIYFGSSSLGIEGLRDIDLLIPYTDSDFLEKLKVLINILGEPNKKREKFAEWEFAQSGYRFEISLLNSQSSSFIERMKVYKILKKNKLLLNEYRQLKKNSNGVSVREYQRRKMEFFNKISAR